VSRVNYGTVDVCVGETTYVMKPTLKAMDKIQSRWPAAGLRGAIEACGALGARDIAFVLAAGAGIGQTEAKDLPEIIFNEGTVNVAPKVVEYLALLINPTGKEDDEPEESPEGE